MDLLIKELKKEFVKWFVYVLATTIIAATAFYFNTRSQLSAHENALNQLQFKVETKADQTTVEKRLDRIENKIDNLIELQIQKHD